MCGGIVSALALSGRNTSVVQRLLCTLFYHGGRIVTYSMLGLLAGLFAQPLMLESVRPLLNGLFLAANAFVVVIGLCTACGVRSFGIAALDGSGWGFLNRLFSRVADSGSLLAAIPAGMLMGLIPCGLVYGVLITADTSGSFLKGGAMMLAFGLGTLPALLAYGQMASTISALGRGIFQRFMGVAVALLGALGVWKGLVKIGFFS
jgi:sulfite exporter TauE/SafE